MSKEEFLLKWRGRFLLHLTEAWACRTHPPSALGQIMDKHALDIKALLSEVYDDLAGIKNGVPAQPQRSGK